jgi:hypothetical protein
VKKEVNKRLAQSIADIQNKYYNAFVYIYMLYIEELKVTVVGKLLVPRFFW